MLDKSIAIEHGEAPASLKEERSVQAMQHVARAETGVGSRLHHRFRCDVE
ncbi:hypothetical protein SCE1572_36200 [Sorangium cellulosum So0157-2]|uniref:Uncharacterized protein n=1 Tax=Sorangium cellulosum So0157-2 TaxID=1254432 RepID=S4Y9J0_SORCE|nr:hypothetical protein SCE1572_36200 [Sorangium cellulosum So0157-2]